MAKIIETYAGESSCPLNPFITASRGRIKKKHLTFFLVYWVHLNDIYQILGGWFTRCLETSMYHIWYNRIERVQKWTILNQYFLFIGAFIHSDIIIWHGKYGKNASSILFTSVQSPYTYQIWTILPLNLANLCAIQCIQNSKLWNVTNYTAIS